jgi:uncharacterized protein YndB with AHSA1/START domain
MDSKFTSKASTTIHAPASKVWDALTKPDLIKQYMFGANVVSDWKEGSPIVYKGEWQGKPYEDKGTILKFERGKRLVSTHWSPLSGTSDSSENYHTLTYLLSEHDGHTDVTLTQDNNASEEEKAESDKNWNAVLAGLKKVAES